MLRLRTDDPVGLLNRFRQLIRQKNRRGRIDTWEETACGFGHTAANWQGLAWFKAEVSGDGRELLFMLHKPRSEYAFAYYHGHLLQVFIEHLNDGFKSARYVDGRKK